MRAWLRASLLHTLLSGSAGVSEGCHRHVNQRIVHQFEHLLREGVQPLPPDTLRLAIGQQVTTGSVLEPCREVLPHETVSDCPNETRAARPGSCWHSRFGPLCNETATATTGYRSLPPAARNNTHALQLAASLAPRRLLTVGASVIELLHMYVNCELSGYAPPSRMFDYLAFRPARTTGLPNMSLAVSQLEHRLQAQAQRGGGVVMVMFPGEYYNRLDMASATREERNLESAEPYTRTGGVTQTPREKLEVRGARHNPPNPRSFFVHSPVVILLTSLWVKQCSRTHSTGTPTEPAWGHPRGVDQVKLRVLEASLI